MILKKCFYLFVILFIAAKPAFAAIVINEFLADPPAGLIGDANLDGTRDSSDDEFIELLNTGAAVGVANWTISDSSGIRHEFSPGTILEAESYFVIFGGGNPTNSDGNALVASTGRLSLNNSGDQIILKDSGGLIISAVTYGAEASQDQSLTRFPEGTGLFELHQTVSSNGDLFSPGRSATPLVSEAIPHVPEPGMRAYVCYLLLLGLGIRLRRQNTSQGV